MEKVGKIGKTETFELPPTDFNLWKFIKNGKCHPKLY